MWHLGAAEMTPAMRGLLAEHGTACVDGLAVAAEDANVPAGKVARIRIETRNVARVTRWLREPKGALGG